MRARRYEFSGTLNSADKIVKSVEDKNVEKLIFYAVEGHPDKKENENFPIPENQFPLGTLLVEEQDPEVDKSYVICDGQFISGLSKEIHYRDVIGALRAASASGKAYFSDLPARYTRHLSPEDAVEALNTVNPRELTQTGLSDYLKMLKSIKLG